MAEKYDIGVVGAGYVGLVTGACLAHVGHRVTCVDRDEGRISELREGRVPIYEPGLEELVERLSGSKHPEERKLFFGGPEDFAEVVAGSDVLFIAVDTPQGDDGAADLSSVAEVARRIGQALASSRTAREKPLIVVNKSTVPVGSGDYVSMLVQEGAEEGGGDGAAGYRVVSNPEFLREGTAIHDSLFPDRVVLGAESRDSLDTMRELYRPIIEQSFPAEDGTRPRAAVPFVTTDLASAEMIKYAANAFLATKISFVNEVAAICELVGADITSVASGIGLDERIGPRFLNAGIGWGGSCFPKDVAALRSIAREYDYEPAILDATVSVNDRQRKEVVSKLQSELRTLKGKRIALLGLAFKPNTDDLRNAPSLEIARMLQSLGARLTGYDPVAGGAVAEVMPELKVLPDPYEALRGAHAAVVVTEWEEVRDLDLHRAASFMEPPKLLVDGRNALEPRRARDCGLLYRGFGRA